MEGSDSQLLRNCASPKDKPGSAVDGRYDGLDVSPSLSALATYRHIGIGIEVGPDYGKSLNADVRRLINLLMRQRFSL